MSELVLVQCSICETVMSCSDKRIWVIIETALIPAPYLLNEGGLSGRGMHTVTPFVEDSDVIIMKLEDK